MSFLLDIAYTVGGVVSSPIWGYRMLRTGKHRTDWPGRFGRVRNSVAAAAGDGESAAGEGISTTGGDGRDDGRPTLLIHAVSVGEINAIRLLVSEVEKQTSQAGQPWRIVISTTTDTGTARAKSLFEPQYQVVRYPFDFSFAIKRFLNAVKPDVVALVENEVWPNFTEICQKRGIAVAVVNGRLTQRSFAGYRKLGSFARRMYRRLTMAAVQNDEYAHRFNQLGTPADRIVVTDTMKWDTAQVADEVPGSDDLAREMGIDLNRPVIVAGSTAPGEERLLIETCPIDAQLLIVPRKPEWFEQVVTVCRQLGCPHPVVRRTHYPAGSKRELDNTRVFLLDTIGELRKAYAFADVVIVGRSFLGLYGSDMIEPVALGKPTIVGPFHADFKQSVDALIAEGGLIVTENPGEVAAELLRDKQRACELARRGRDVIVKRQGATVKTTKLLKKLMPEKESRPTVDGVEH